MENQEEPTSRDKLGAAKTTSGGVPRGASPAISVVVQLPNEKKSFFSRHRDNLDFWLKIAGIAIAVGTFVYLQRQINIANEQTTVLWESIRPVLDFAPAKPNHDITHITDSVLLPNGRYIRDTLRYFIFHATVSNVGQSPAQIISWKYKKVSTIPGNVANSEWIQRGQPIVQGHRVVETVPIILVKEETSLITLSYRYTRDGDVSPDRYWTLIASYEISYDKDGWHARLSDSEYSSVFKAYTDSLSAASFPGESNHD